MLEITIDNCHKCDFETINDPNNSQFFWNNRRHFEIETKRNSQVIFDNSVTYPELFWADRLYLAVSPPPFCHMVGRNF